MLWLHQSPLSFERCRLPSSTGSVGVLKCSHSSPRLNALAMQPLQPLHLMLLLILVLMRQLRMQMFQRKVMMMRSAIGCIG